MAAKNHFVRQAREALGEGAVLAGEDAAPHEVDFWRVYSGKALCVLKPRTVEQVQACVRLAAEHGVPVVPQGGNTGLVAGGIPDESGRMAVLSLERMTRIRGIDPLGRHVTAEAGCVLADVQAAAEAKNRLFPLSLGAEGSCRIGGNLATNAGGVNVLRYGMTREAVLGLEVVLPDGRVWDGLRSLRKDNTGYDLKQLFVGSEGTLGVITAACLRLWPRPREVASVWLAVEEPDRALDALGRFQDRFGELVSCFELISGFGVEAALTHFGAKRPVETRAPWHVLAEVAWSLEEGLIARVEEACAELFEAETVTDGAIAQSEDQRAAFWKLREGQSEATRGLGDTVRNDVSVDPARLPGLIEAVGREAKAIDGALVSFPFGHLGDGNLHVNVLLPDGKSGLRGRVQEAVSALVLDAGGSISAEHGVGRAKRAGFEAQKSPLEVELMLDVKRCFDPRGLFNPGAILRE